MTREAKLDFESLVRYLSNYTISDIVKGGDFKTQLRTSHGAYLSMLTFLAELRDQISSTKKPSSLPTEEQLSFLNESTSDLGQAFFNWTHGGYKACRVMLRSSIETFTKGICCEELPRILTEKKMHVVFSTASSSSSLGCIPNQQLFNELHSKYATLCLDVHTASAVNMANISSLNYFPSFDPEIASKTSNDFMSVACRMVTLLCLIYNDSFHSMHHRNKENIRDSIIGKYKVNIQNIL